MIRQEYPQTEGCTRNEIHPSRLRRVFTQAVKSDLKTPCEKWYEPSDEVNGYRIIVEKPGKGRRHVVTPDDIRERLAQFPPEMLRSLEIVKLSRMTRKLSYECIYGMQWGNTIYMYPMEDDLMEKFDSLPDAQSQMETGRYGAKHSVENGSWVTRWNEQTIRDFYLNNILIHELGHTLDDHNRSAHKREAFANH